jgi:hypothetical protein
MSCPISRLLADCQSPLRAAVSEVAENSLFAFVDASDRAAFDEAVASGQPDRWLRTSIRFARPENGRLELAADAELLRRLSAAFVGAESPDDIGESSLLDFAGELTNQVCGAWLTRVCQHDAFSLKPPVAEQAAPDPVPSEGACALFVSIDDSPVRLTVSWEARKPE